MKVINKHKARFIFKNKDNCSIIKGFIQEYSDDSSPRYFIYGANNLDFVNDEIRLILINEGVSSLKSLKKLVPSFKLCICDNTAKNINIKDKNIVFEDFSVDNHLHITLDYSLIKKIKDETEKRLRLKKDVLEKRTQGIIQPNISLTISEILMDYFLSKAEDN